MNRKTWVMFITITLFASVLVSCVKVTIKEPADKAAESSGGVTEPTDRVTEPEGNDTEPAGESTEPEGNDTEPKGNDMEPAGESTEQMDEPAEPTDNTAEPAGEVANPANEPAEQAGKAPELSDDDVLELYFKAREAYEWFDMTTIPFDTEKYIDTDIGPYYEVNQKGITSKQALADYLNGILREDITERLMSESSDRYVESDGKLYVIPADRGTDIFKGEESYEITRSSDTEIKFTVTVEVFEDFDQENRAGYEKHDFFLEFSHHLWRFKNFGLVR